MQYSFDRLGGEEFAANLPVSMPEAAEKAEAVRYAFSKAGRAVIGLEAEVRVSVRCSGFRYAAPVEALLRGADLALYRAKDHGRNIVMPT